MKWIPTGCRGIFGSNLKKCTDCKFDPGSKKCSDYVTNNGREWVKNQ